ncbi:MAG: hypothetical protein AAF682_17720 [Planctomycetota bacterium]
MRFRDAYDPFRALRAAFQLIQRAPATILVGSCLLMVCHWSVGFQFSDDPDDAPLVVFLGCAMCVLSLVFFGLNALFTLGFATAVERVSVQGEERIGDLFRAHGRFWPYVLAYLLHALVALVAFGPFALFIFAAALLGGGMGGEEAGIALGILAFLLSLPGYVYILLGISLVPYAAAFERLMPFDALVRSWKLVSGNRLWLFWFYVVQMVFTLLGMLLCCIGVIATGMVSTIATFDAYLRLVRDDQEQWATEGGPGAPLGSLAADDPDDADW